MNDLLRTPTTDRGLKPETTGSVVSADVDWITVTTPDDRRGYDLWDIAKKYWSDNGVEKSAWANKWYTGYSGCGVYWGVGKQGTLMMASGQAAPTIAPTLLPVAHRVTRIDAQVTVEMPRQTPNVPTVWYDYCLERNYHKTRGYTLINNSAGGATLSVGSRQSDQYGRFYDKGIEAGLAEAGKLYRYEVELKKPRSGSFSADLVNSMRKGQFPRKDLAWFVYSWFLDRGIIPMFKPMRAGNIAARAITVQSDNEKRLRWLQTQVRPTVGRLISDMGEQSVFDALGLSEFLS